MRALVTGAGGFVGRALVRCLAEDGIAVRALVRHGLTAPADVPPGVELVRGDVADPASLPAAVAGCELVFHCAWGGDTLAEARRVNVDGTRHVLEAAAAAGVRRVVHLSSMAVHGPRPPRLLREDAPLVGEGGDAYARSKCEGERLAFERGAALGVEVVALRPSLIYGPGAPLWVVDYCERVRRGAVRLIDGGRGLANLVYLDDVVAALRAAARAPVAGQAFLVSGAAPITWREYLGYFAAMSGAPLPPSLPAWRARLALQWSRVYATLAERPRRLRDMDLTLMTQHTAVRIDKARRLLDWRPRIEIADGMARCERWLRAQGHLPPAASGPRAARRAAAG